MSRYFTYNEQLKLPNPGKGPPPGSRGNKQALPEESTVAWPELAGPPQPRDRGVGIPKVKTHVSSRGV